MVGMQMRRTRVAGKNTETRILGGKGRAKEGRRGKGWLPFDFNRELGDGVWIGAFFGCGKPVIWGRVYTQLGE